TLAKFLILLSIPDVSEILAKCVTQRETAELFCRERSDATREGAPPRADIHECPWTHAGRPESLFVLAHEACCRASGAGCFERDPEVTGQLLSGADNLFFFLSQRVEQGLFGTGHLVIMLSFPIDQALEVNSINSQRARQPDKIGKFLESLPQPGKPERN